MKMLTGFGFFLFLIMGGMIYLSQSLGLMVKNQQENKVFKLDLFKSSSGDIFSLPREDLKIKLDQLSDIKKRPVEGNLSEAQRFPSGTIEVENYEEENEAGAVEAMEEYKEKIAKSLTEQYQNLLVSSQGLSFEDLEEKRIQIVNFKNENGIAVEFIETIPLDQVYAVYLSGKDVYELGPDDIKKIRNEYTQEEIIKYFKQRNSGIEN